MTFPALPIETLVAALAATIALLSNRRLRRRIERLEAVAAALPPSREPPAPAPEPLPSAAASTPATLDPVKAHATLKAIAGHGFAACPHHGHNGCFDWCRAQAVDALTSPAPKADA